MKYPFSLERKLNLSAAHWFTYFFHSDSNSFIWGVHGSFSTIKLFYASVMKSEQLFGI